MPNLPAPAKAPTSIEPFDQNTDREIEELASRTLNAGGVLMAGINFVSGKVENAMDLLPGDAKQVVEQATAKALEACYEAASTVGGASYAPDMGKFGHKVAVMASGAAGGSTGMPSTFVELPVTISIMFGSIQRIARSYGFDPTAEEVRMECIEVLGSGGPLKDDNSVDISFLASKVMVTGTSVHALIARVAPQLAVVMGQKLGAQAIPVVGAATGATMNYAFLSYFEEMAHVRFGLRKLAQQHGLEPVTLAYKSAVRAKRTSGRKGKV